MNTEARISVLSIDAWRYERDWTWNQWFKVGSISQSDYEALNGSPRKIFAWLRDEGYLSEGSKGKVALNDDCYNLVIEDRKTHEPLFALEYGPLYN